MKVDNLADAITDLDEDIIVSAERNSSKKSNNKRFSVKWTVIPAAACIAALLITAAVIGASQKPKILTLTETPESDTGSANDTQTENVPDTDGTSGGPTFSGDAIGVISVNGVLYVQDPDISAQDCSKGEYLGKASDFEGTYLYGLSGIDGDVYRCSGENEALLVELDNGGSVILSKSMDGGRFSRLPEELSVKVTGNGASDEKFREFLSENRQSIVSSLEQSGVPANDISFSDEGYGHLNITDKITFNANFKDYLIYNGDELAAIITLMNGEDGKIYQSVSFGANWFDEFDEALKRHRGEKLLFVYYGYTEIALCPDGKFILTSTGSEYDADRYFGVDGLYGKLMTDQATYTP